MVNFGYPYNDLVICKDSTDYLPYKPRKQRIKQPYKKLNLGKKITGTCMQHNVDIEHLKTLENLKQREELKTKIQTSRMQTLLADNQNKSKTTNILSNRNANNIDTLPKYMTSLCRKECSAVFRYKCRMLDVKGNFPGGLENILCLGIPVRRIFFRHTFWQEKNDIAG